MSFNLVVLIFFFSNLTVVKLEIDKIGFSLTKVGCRDECKKSSPE